MLDLDLESHEPDRRRAEHARAVGVICCARNGRTPRPLGHLVFVEPPLAGVVREDRACAAEVGQRQLDAQLRSKPRCNLGLDREHALVRQQHGKSKRPAAQIAPDTCVLVVRRPTEIDLREARRRWCAFDPETPPHERGERDGAGTPEQPEARRALDERPFDQVPHLVRAPVEQLSIDRKRVVLDQLPPIREQREIARGERCSEGEPSAARDGEAGLEWEHGRVALRPRDRRRAGQRQQVREDASDRRPPATHVDIEAVDDVVLLAVEQDSVAVVHG